MSANFNFYLNRQGAQGRQGEQGEAGYSPTISVDTNTAAEYKLRIQNETTSFVTPNLRGNAIEDTGGTYVRYNPVTQMFETGFIDQATSSAIGGVLITPVGGLEAGGTDVDVPTSAEVYDYVESKITSIGEGYVKEEDFADSMEQIASELDEKISFDNLASSLVEGSNITLDVNSENNTITINATGGDLSNYVTLDTTQTITGVKNFLNGLNSQGNFNISGTGSYLMLNNSVFRQDVNSNNLDISSPASILFRTSTRNVDVNDILTSSSLSNVVTTNTAQTITNSKTFDGNGVIHFSDTSNGLYFKDSSSTERIRIFAARHSGGTDYSDLTMQSYSDMQFRLLSPATTVKLTEIKSGIELAGTALQQSDLTPITDLIPTQASSSNQLADKAFVNSSIATNTANFIGTFNSLADLEAYSGTVTNNDYAFVVGQDTAGNTTYSRYKYNASTSTWNFEYVLNNSSFTASQWAAINSSITATLVAQISTNQANIASLQSSKQDVILDLATIRSGAAAGSTAVQPADLADYAKLNQSQFFTALQNFSGGISLPTGNSINFHSPTTGSSGIISSPSGNTLQIKANTININSGGSSPIVKNLFDMIQLSDLSIATTSSNWLNYDNSTGEFSANVDTVVTQNSNNLVTSDAVYDGLETKQNVIADLSSIRSGAELGSTSEQLENKVSLIDGTSSDTEYPSAKCVYDNLETKADTKLSNLSTNGNSKLHAIKGYYEELNQLNDIEGFSYYKNNLHSTFDLSKFTVVGSPNITDDGIASGFSSGNYLTTIYSGTTKDFEVLIPFTVETLDATHNILGQMLFLYANGRFVSDIGDGSKYGNVYATVNTNYLAKIKLKNGYHSLNISIDNGANWVEVFNVVNTNTYTFNNIAVGCYNNYNYFKGSIDLKQFSITVDGVEVFSGNKTGIDIHSINNSTISIPYIETIQGDRIADIQYLIQAQQIYETTGNCDEVILDQTNQVYYLPAGSIYGKMNKKIGNIETLLNNINSGSGS